MSEIKKIAIVDDEQHSIDALIWELEVIHPGFQYEIHYTSTNPLEALESLKSLPVDILFLDVEMPYLSGIDLLSQLGKFNFEVIFSTAYDKYAFRAFQFSAFGYLLKPVDKDSLEKCLLKYGERLHFQQQLQQNVAVHTFGKISIPTLEGYEFVETNRIIRLEANSNYTILYLTENKKILVSKTMADIEQKLPSSNFFRTHKSHVIQLAFVHKYLKGKTPSVQLIDGSIVPVSPNKKDHILQLLNIR